MIDKPLVAVALFNIGAVSAISEARRIIQQGGVVINGERVTDLNTALPERGFLRVGKRRFYRIENYQLVLMATTLEGEG